MTMRVWWARQRCGCTRSPELHGESGYWVAADARGAGVVATRAVELLTGLAGGSCRCPTSRSSIAPGNNAASPGGRAPRRVRSEHRRELREFKGALSEFAIWRR